MAQPEQIRRVLRRQPFRPFSIRMVDGTVYTVKHPDRISIPRLDRAREVIYYQMPEGVEPTKIDPYEVHWIDLALVSEVIQMTTVLPNSEPDGNGP